MRAAVGQTVTHPKYGEGTVTSHPSTGYTFVKFGQTAGSRMCSDHNLSPVKHEPVMDDGVQYCGWTTEAGTFGGCGQVWPCTAARASTP